MPVVRTPISVRELADAVGVEPERFVAIEKRPEGWYVVTEPDDAVQTTGTCPPLSDHTKRKPKRGK